MHNLLFMEIAQRTAYLTCNESSLVLGYRDCKFWHVHRKSDSPSADLSMSCWRLPNGASSITKPGTGTIAKIQEGYTTK